jgi:D-aminoacyl-tRNA deacylase
MKAVIQRVKKAAVEVNNKMVSSIGGGLLIFLAVSGNDSEKEAGALSDKIIHLRIFRDSLDKMNLSVQDVKKEALVISQFTLYGDCYHGRRPSFIKAASPLLAEKLYNFFVEEMRKYVPVLTGVFGALMQVSLINDGPSTFILDTEEMKNICRN